MVYEKTYLFETEQDRANFDKSVNELILNPVQEQQEEEVVEEVNEEEEE
jgi:hypothetical protein